MSIFFFRNRRIWNFMFTTKYFQNTTSYLWKNISSNLASCMTSGLNKRNIRAMKASLILKIPIKLKDNHKDHSKLQVTRLKYFPLFFKILNKLSGELALHFAIWMARKQNKRAIANAHSLNKCIMLSSSWLQIQYAWSTWYLS